MNILITLLNTLTQNITALGFILYIAHVNLKKLFNIKFIINFVVYSSILYVIQNHDNNQLMLALIAVLSMQILTVYINSDCSLNHSVSVVLFGYLFTSACQLIVISCYLIFNIKFDDNDASDPYLLTVFVFYLILVIVLNYLLPLQKWADRFCNISYASSLFFIGSLLIYCIYSLIRSEFSFGTLLSTGTTLILLLIFALLTFIQSFQDMKRKQVLKDYSTYMPIIDTMIDNIQKKQHLYNNRILSLSQLTNTYDNYTDLCNALNEITHIEPADKYSYDFLHLENKLLAGLLFSKISVAENKNLNIIFTIYNYDYNSRCTDSEIVDITGILLDNAIEACKPNENIYVSIGQKNSNSINDKFKLKVENPGPAATDKFIHTMFAKRFTTKKEKNGHGLGLHIVKSVIKKYDGSITVFNSSYSDTNYLSIEVEI